MGWMDKMTKNLNKAAVFLADPNELSKLDGECLVLCVYLRMTLY